MIEYSIKFPKTEVRFMDTQATFTINHIKSRLMSTLYFIFHGYDLNDDEVYTYVSPRWVITDQYTRKTKTFNLAKNLTENTKATQEQIDAIEKIAYCQIELRAVGNSSENPLYFNECMLNEGGYKPYSTPNRIVEAEVGLNKSSYVNLYTDDGNFLQVIRPTQTSLLTNCLTKCPCTVIAPHLEDESDIDDPVNIFMEFINQREQRIDVLR